MNRIVICLPHNYDQFDKDFVFSLLRMQEHFYEWIVKEKRDDNLSIIAQGGFRLDHMRNQLVETAIKYEQTHILFLDTDMTFPKETIQWMVEDLEQNEDQGVEAITGLYTWKKKPFLPHIYSKYDEDSGAFLVAGNFPLDNLFKVEAAGTGILMLKTSIFDRVDKPYFKFGEPEKPKYTGAAGEVEIKHPMRLGEDMYFCLKARPLILCDPRISCKHFKKEGYGVDDYIDSNGLKRKDGSFTGTPEQWDTIDKLHGENTSGGTDF